MDSILWRKVGESNTLSILKITAHGDCSIIFSLAINLLSRIFIDTFLVTELTLTDPMVPLHHS